MPYVTCTNPDCPERGRILATAPGVPCPRCNLPMRGPAPEKAEAATGENSACKDYAWFDQKDLLIMRLLYGCMRGMQFAQWTGQDYFHTVTDPLKKLIDEAVSKGYTAIEWEG